MITKAAYIERRHTSLKALDAEITRLTDYAEGATPNAVLQYHKAIRRLQHTRNTAALKLRELGTLREATWATEEATAGAEHAWRDLRHAVLVAISATYNEERES